MAKKDKKAAVIVPTPSLKKEVYKPRLDIPAGNPDRHIVRITRRTWLLLQPGSTQFIGQFTSKQDALAMAERHIAVTKGKVVCHA